jgi:hypothetical protein
MPAVVRFMVILSASPITLGQDEERTRNSPRNQLDRTAEADRIMKNRSRLGRVQLTRTGLKGLQ